MTIIKINKDIIIEPLSLPSILQHYVQLKLQIQQIL